MHVFVGNFTCVVDFMIVEDISSIIDPRLNNERYKSVCLGTRGQRRGSESVMSKILGFYKEYLELGPEYLTRIDDEGEVTNVIILAPSSERFDPLPMHIGNLYADDRKISKIVKAVERNVLLLKAKKESSDKECSTSGSEDEEYAMAVRHIKKFVKRRENALDVATHSILWECPKPLKIRTKRAFVGGSWSDSGEEDDEKVKDEMCLVAHASSEVCSESSYFSDQNSSIDDIALDNEYNNLHSNGITHNFSAPRTPQSNGVVERKNRTLQEMSRTMLNEQSLPQKFWCNAVDTSTYILNRILIRAILGKTPYELLRGRKPTLDYFRVFGSKCFILNTKDYLTKFDPKSYEGVFLGYSQNSKAYIILNKHTRKIKESLNVTFDETPPPSKTSPLVDDDLDEEEAIREIEKKNLENDIVDETLEVDEIINIKESRNHPLENVIGNLNQITLRSQAQNQSNFFCFISTIEPKNVNEALGDESWIVAMQEELNQFVANDVWELVPQPRNMTIIGTKWVFRNKLDENGIVSRNKARILLSYACTIDFKLFQMDVKSAFLNAFINEEVYVAQPLGFIDFEKPDHVYKLNKALYGLKQAPKAWCMCYFEFQPWINVLQNFMFHVPPENNEFEGEIITLVDCSVIAHPNLRLVTSFLTPTVD
ncbi:retrovirus-related pol polyprotein from transposon TNT 1-94 [Tanacetum coccineum]